MLLLLLELQLQYFSLLAITSLNPFPALDDICYRHFQNFIVRAHCRYQLFQACLEVRFVQYCRKRKVSDRLMTTSRSYLSELLDSEMS